MEIFSGKGFSRKRAEDYENMVGVRFIDKATNIVGNLANVKPTTFIDKSHVERSALL